MGFAIYTEIYDEKTHNDGFEVQANHVGCASVFRVVDGHLGAGRDYAAGQDWAVAGECRCGGGRAGFLQDAGF